MYEFIKKGILIYYIFSSQQVFSQTVDFRNYSYHIYNLSSLDSGTNLITATAFFIKKNTKTYLVSAKHVFVEDETHKLPDSMTIRMFDSIKGYVSENLAIKKLSLNPAKLFLCPNADVAALEIEILSNVQINSLENYVTKRIPLNITYDKASVYGYSGKKKETVDQSINEETIICTGRIFNNLDTISPTFSKYFLPENYFIENHDQICEGGFSGSPVMLSTSNNEIYFGGICIAGDPNTIVIVQPTYIKCLYDKF